MNCARYFFFSADNGVYLAALCLGGEVIAIIVQEFTGIVLPALFAFFLIGAFTCFGVAVFFGIIAEKACERQGLGTFGVIGIEHIANRAEIKILHIFHKLAHLL